MADRKISLKDLANRVGIANVNLSNIKTGKISAIRFSTLDAICDVLDCQPGDILEYRRPAAGDNTLAQAADPAETNRREPELLAASPPPPQRRGPARERPLVG